MSEKEMRIPIECKHHHILYDAYDTRCPECQKEFEAGERIIRRLTCDLCGELKGTTQMYCGGPVGRMCDDCKRIVHRFLELEKSYKKFWRGRRKAQKENQKLKEAKGTESP